ncbi:hypothetical protein B0H16DRAFT_1579726 [Mycena metata]|uniref:Uncharacterized protein n=1 Tax=Mycena metata TaxID=1033252 RepID=A0AAD7MUZ0_9AGAR|nr:hypothetical protein B0H16DRAFT_1579726 [Mycena metata]
MGLHLTAFSSIWYPDEYLELVELLFTLSVQFIPSMPKTPKTPVKARPRPKPLRSPKKKPSSSEFIDDEAESDDGVLVGLDSPHVQAQDLSLPRNGHEGDGIEVAVDSLDEYEADFINDGDPFEDVEPDPDSSSSPRRSPPKRRAPRSTNDGDSSREPSPSPSRIQRGKPSKADAARSPSKKIKPSEDVIEVDDTSEEDLTAMDVDDSMFRKPPGVKASALPPSLVTRSAAAKAASAVPKPDGVPTSSERINPEFTISSDGDAMDPPAIVNGAMNPAMVAFVTQLLSQQADVKRINAVEKGPSLTTSTSSRVDHDELALQAGIERSLRKPLPKRDTNPKTPDTRHSPDWEDWDPPSVSQVLSDLKKGSHVDAPESTNSNLSKGIRSQGSVSVKGKGKARVSSPSPQLEAVTSDEEPLPVTKTPTAKPATRSTTSSSTLFHSKEVPDGEEEPAAPSNKKSSPSKTGASSSKKRVNREPVSSDEGKPDASLAGFLVKFGYPDIARLSDVTADTSTLTMAQFKRVAKEGASAVEAEADDEPSGSDDVDTVFLEDIEVYRAYFNPKAKCGVFDIRLQAPSLRPTYPGLHPLPANRRILPAYDRNRNSLEDIDYTTGGGVNWESWYNQNPRMLASNSIGAIVFVEAKPNFCNISRISPLRLNTRISAGSSSTYRLHVDDRIAICVSVICTTESHLVAAKRIGVKSERMRKWVAGVMHDQEWERFESATCLLFHEQVMYTQMTNRAISFQTMISPDPRTAPDSSQTDQRQQRSLPSSMFSQPSPGKKSGPAQSRSSGSKTKTLLAHSDVVPIYDARRTVVDFSHDLSRLDELLPIFPGEIPVGSYTVVGYTLSSYMAVLSGTSDRVPHVGCNILWAIVCGTPSVGGSRS